MKAPIATHEVDHEVVVIDLFTDADGMPVAADEIVAAVNASAEIAGHLAACVSALQAAGVKDVSFIDDALASLEGRSGTANGRAWSCAQGRITWQT